MDETPKVVKLRRRKALGSAIRTRRETLGMSRSQFAQELGTSRNATLEWETGEVSPSIERLWDVCDVLQCTPSQLLGSAEDIDVDLDPDY